MNLSKSRYTAYCQCPKNLWLGVNHPELVEPDAARESRFAQGNEVGDLAKQLFHNTVDVTTHTVDRLDIQAMIEKTRQCIADGVECIAEAAFSHGGCYCAVDLLHREGAGWAIYEVKSSTYKSDKDDTADHLRVYTQDIAYQRYVLEQCGLKVAGTNLVRLDSRYIRGEELDIHGLFHIKDMATLVEEEYAKLATNIPLAKRVLQSKVEPAADIDAHCNAPYACAFFKHCLGDVPQPNVFDLYRMNFDKKCALYREGKVDFESLRGESLTDMQQLQVESYLSNRPLVDADAIQQYLSQLSYPLYFLDFETYQTAVPQLLGTTPYQQIPFQYSLHYIEHEGGEIKHKEFLGESGTDPRRALAEQICKDIPMGVCTTAYNKGFECGRLQELAEAYPDLANHLNDIADHIVDLIDPFRQKMLYLPEMNGSFSIKRVLPSLFPGDPELDYNNLTGCVHHGGEAMDIFPRIKDMPPAEAAHARESLLRYCELDTWAMVKVWQKLKEVVK
ncbi:MAG: DUF2779 domain-containing protein [Bacteroidales bacterium]|nr:DUF2779 domain-containing protein [Bacteroidales bacterium]